MGIGIQTQILSVATVHGPPYGSVLEGAVGSVFGEGGGYLFQTSLAPTLLCGEGGSSGQVFDWTRGLANGRNFVIEII